MRAAATLPIPLRKPDELGPGTRVHHFEIIRELGRGGMGRVYLARDVRLARRVALKFLLSESSDLTARFLVEARNTAQCRDQNIVVIYEVDEWNGAPYMALEYLEGTPLGEVMEAGRLAAPRILEIATGVARALVSAHARGIVHCDLKPDNILVLQDGNVKVLDFGIARLLGAADDDRTSAGTPRYMAPEQWGTDGIDPRTDLWAMGIILWELIARCHPLGAQPTVTALMAAAVALDTPMPRLATAANVPTALDELVARCLCKRRTARLASAQLLLDALLDMAPSRRALPPDAPPFVGMAAFEEADAARFFGRERDVARTVGRVLERPLVVLAGPSGVGKSSFVRAGVVPVLKAGGAWRAIVLRPGRAPLDALAAACADLEVEATPGPELAARFLVEPGALGAIMRGYAARTGQRVIVFVDQFEEVFTLVREPAAVAAFIACLAGAADDETAPVRVLVSIRSDFLDALGDHPALLERVGEGLVFLRPLAAAALREALEQPLVTTGYQFEPGIVEDVVEQLGDVAGALPLVQFAAASLWDTRDVASKRLTRLAYDRMGGIVGALATHAEDVVHQLPPRRRALLRTVLARLVTPTGTRAVIDRAELESLDREVVPLLDALIASRLLAVSGQTEQATVELVHESLIRAWPTLRRWREEDGEDAAFVAQLRTAARQWDHRGRPAGLLWSGDSIGEARVFLARYTGELAAREVAFLDAGLAVADRALRRRRRALVGVFALLAMVAATATIAAVWIGSAEQTAHREAARAEEAKTTAEHEAARAREAEAEAKRQLDATRAAEGARDAEHKTAEDEAARLRDSQGRLDDANGKVEQQQVDLERANQQLRRALAASNDARGNAEQATRRAEDLAGQLQKALAAEKARADEAERRASGLAKGKNLR